MGSCLTPSRSHDRRPMADQGAWCRIVQQVVYSSAILSPGYSVPQIVRFEASVSMPEDISNRFGICVEGVGAFCCTPLPPPYTS